MKIRFTIGAIIAAAMICLSTSQTKADTLSAFAIAGGNTNAPNVNYTAGGGGGLSIFTADGFIKSKVGLGMGDPVTISFSNLANTGSYTFNSTTGSFDQLLAGGSFSIFNGSTTFLSGTFGTSDLTGENGAQSGNVNLTSNSVTFTGGTLFPSTYSHTGGTLAIEFNSTSQFVANSSGISSFTGVDGITFSAPPTRGSNGGGNPVPEPGSFAVFSFGAAGLLGLLARSRKARFGATLAL